MHLAILTVIQHFFGFKFKSHHSKLFFLLFFFLKLLDCCSLSTNIESYFHLFLVPDIKPKKKQKLYSYVSDTRLAPLIQSFTLSLSLSFVRIRLL